MAVDLLDAPLRVSWDICAADDRLNTDQLRRVAQQLIDAGIFFVSLEADPLKHPDILVLLEQLTSGGCQVSLTLSGDAAELALLDLIPTAAKLYLDCSFAINAQQFNPARLKPVLSKIRNAQREPSLFWIPRHGELLLLLEMLDFCALESIHDFKLPNQKISVNPDPEGSRLLPTCNDLDQLAAAIKSTGFSELPHLQLEVHDLFLWELLQPLSGGNRSEYGGCQAANSLGHVDAAGRLYPCSSWPEPFGDLLADNLLDLWQTGARLDVRRQIAEIPVGCEDCRDYKICFGGCRGLSRFCRDDGLKRDLLCASKR